MNKTKNKPYNLLHITSKENAKKILNDGFIPSVHNLKKNQNQWLGDGVYFWDGNDDNITDFGKRMLKNKFPKSNMVELYGSIEIDNNKHVNLEKEEDRDFFCDFIKKINPKKAEEMITVIRTLRGEVNANPAELAKVGKFLGKNINTFLKAMNKQGYEIDMVSCYFFHGSNKVENIFGRREKNRRQFCIKNINLLNNNIDKFKIYNNN